MQFSFLNTHYLRLQWFVLECVYLYIINIYIYIYIILVGIATRYGLDGPGLEFRWGRDFPHPSRPALGPIQPPVQRVPGVKRQERGVDHPPTSSAEVKERVELYLYSPSGPSWTVLGWTFSYTYNFCGGAMCLFAHVYHLPTRKMHSSRKRPQKSLRVLTLDFELLRWLLNPQKRLTNCRVGLAAQIRLLQTSTCTALTGTTLLFT
jgi:hypothetical protein